MPDHHKSTPGEDSIGIRVGLALVPGGYLALGISTHLDDWAAPVGWPPASALASVLRHRQYRCRDLDVFHWRENDPRLTSLEKLCIKNADACKARKSQAPQHPSPTKPARARN